MAKSVRRRGQKKEALLPLGKKNFQIIGIGLVVIFAGYMAMKGQPVEGFLPLVLAPILLVLGYCIIIPIGILYKEKKTNGAKPDQVGSTSHF